jgi:hypothetical protein
MAKPFELAKTASAKGVPTIKVERADCRAASTAADGIIMTDEHARKRHEMYKDMEVAVDPLWSAGTKPDKVYWQEGFYRSYRYLWNLNVRNDFKFFGGGDVHLVHGECILALGAHAWVELPGDILFDGVLQRFYKLSACKAWSWYKYTAAAAGILLANMPVEAEGTRYDFFRPLGLPWAEQGKPPMVIDHDQASELLVWQRPSA